MEPDRPTLLSRLPLLVTAPLAQLRTLLGELCAAAKDDPRTALHPADVRLEAGGLRLAEPGPPPPEADGEVRGYAAPEVNQRHAEIQDPRRALVYSVAAIAYHVLTGQAPLSAASQAALVIRQLLEQPAAPSALRPGLSAAVDDVLLSALQRDPAARPASVAELGQALDAALAGAASPVALESMPALESMTQAPPTLVGAPPPAFGPPGGPPSFPSAPSGPPPFAAPASAAMAPAPMAQGGRHPSVGRGAPGAAYAAMAGPVTGAHAAMGAPPAAAPASRSRWRFGALAAGLVLLGGAALLSRTLTRSPAPSAEPAPAPMERPMSAKAPPPAAAPPPTASTSATRAQPDEDAPAPAPPRGTAKKSARPTAAPAPKGGSRPRIQGPDEGMFAPDSKPVHRPSRTHRADRAAESPPSLPEPSAPSGDIIGGAPPPPPPPAPAPTRPPTVDLKPPPDSSAAPPPWVLPLLVLLGLTGLGLIIAAIVLARRPSRPVSLPSQPPQATWPPISTTGPSHYPPPQPPQPTGPTPWPPPPPPPVYPQNPPEQATIVLTPTPPVRTKPAFSPFSVGHYRCVAPLGEGGMGMVYRATDNLDRACAVKVLLPQVAAQQSAVALFRREARLAASINHPHSVFIYDFGEVPGGLLYLAMEFIEGHTLSALLRPPGRSDDEPGERLPLPRVLHITRQIAEVLDTAHRLGVVHRDLKPQNVMLTPRPSDRDFVKVVDFGIARSLTPDSTYKTQVGAVLGTPAYMSPEQALGESDLDPRSDLFSLGLLVYRMLGGILPYGGTGLTPVQQIVQRAFLREPPPSLRSLRPDLPPMVEAAVMHALQPDRALRTPSAAQFLAELP